MSSKRIIIIINHLIEIYLEYLRVCMVASSRRQHVQRLIYESPFVYGLDSRMLLRLLNHLTSQYR